MRRLRALLRTAPDNAFALLDYAQLQAAVGKLPSAERAIRTALSLAPNNRTVIRSAARFFVHAGKPDTAHRLIRRHERTPSDPWLMASEIALADAAGAQASFLAKGKRMLRESTRFSPGHLTELAGAVALTELDAGNLKRAREAQRRALLLPNDNVIAQAVDHEYLFGLQLEGSIIETALARSSEALLLKAWANLAPDSVEQQAQNWHSEEPFSSRPIQILTTLYAYTGDFEKFMRWIRAGLLTDPNDSGLLINLAYGQARMTQIVEATLTIRKLRSLGSSTAEPFVKATEGLIAYQQGRFETGDELYNAAIALLNSTQTKENAAYGRLNQALSALDYQHPNAAEIVRQANDALRGHATSDSAMLLKIRNTKAIDDVQLEHQELRRLSQWRYDPITNSLIERRGITAVNAKPMTNLDPVYKKI